MTDTLLSREQVDLSGDLALERSLGPATLAITDDNQIANTQKVENFLRHFHTHITTFRHHEDEVVG